MFIFFAYSQQYKIQTYQMEDGLPSNFVKEINQDEHGFIWIATDNGLSRFDGKNFQNFREQLPIQYVKSLFESNQGNLYAITDNGVVEIISQPDSVIINDFMVKSKDEINFNYSKTLFEDCRGNLWLMRDSAIIRYKEGKMQEYNFHSSYFNLSSFLRSFVMWEMSCGDLYVFSQSGLLMRYSEEEDKFIPYVLDVTYLPEIKQLINRGVVLGVNHVLPYQGDVLLATASGILKIKIDKKAKKFYPTVWEDRNTPYTFLHLLPNHHFLASTLTKGILYYSQTTLKQYKTVPQLYMRVFNHLFEDREGNIWASSDGGVALLKPHLFQSLNEGVGTYFYTTKNEVLTIRKDSLIKVEVDKNGTVQETFLYKNSKLSNVNPLLTFAQNDTIWTSFEAGTITRITAKDEKSIGLNIGGYAFPVKMDKNGNIWGGSVYNIFPYVSDNSVFSVSQEMISNKYQINSSNFVNVEVTKDNEILAFGVGRNNSMFQFSKEEGLFKNISPEVVPNPQNLPDSIGYFVVGEVEEDRKGIVWTSAGVGLWKMKDSKLERHILGNDYDLQPIKHLRYDSANDGLWLATNIGLLFYDGENLSVFDEREGLPSPNINYLGVMKDKNGVIWVNTANGIAYTSKNIKNYNQTPTPMLLKTWVNGIQHKELKSELPYHALLKLQFASLTFPSEKTMYRYRFLGNNQEYWSQPDNSNEILLPQLENGTYKIEIQARKFNGNQWSETLTIDITVANVWYRTWWGISLLVVTALGLLAGFAVLYSRRLVEQKKHLEKIVAERTAEIYKQKEEIETQRDSIEKQREVIAAKNKNIQSSIQYAKRIQNAMLPQKEDIDTHLKGLMIYFRPKDIVSGDFYWFTEVKKGGKTFIVIAAVDCTGHGVPGAFMSLIGNEALKHIVKENRIVEPDKILFWLDKEVNKSLQQKQSENKDGMDLVLCVYQVEDKKLEFSGAMNPLYYIETSNNEEEKPSLKEIKGTKLPIGGTSLEEKAFTKHIINISQPTTLYLCSDGYQDQFGGKDKKKFMTKRFKELLVEIYQLKETEQHEILETTLVNWMKEGNEEQIDDVLVLGVKLG
jgi:ligand-binding sensor domain-containing protein/serine phosphatase RsbU (regulator of sigma subunit)